LRRTPLAGRDAYKHWQPVQTRWSDNDVYGHINNAVYYQWFDLAVNNWLINNDLLDIISGDIIGLVVETSCQYAKALSYPDRVDVGLSLKRLGSSSVTYRLGVFGAGSQISAAEARFTHVYVDRANRRPLAVDERWRAKLENLRNLP
jgi:acyl-CoA thioester hydrolase